MSHLKARKETNCLNCGTQVHGRYCHFCGQENIEPKESAWHLVTHFFQDITHFDGKFFSTVKYLVTKPGFLSREYMLGRRAAYLNPIRMYIFTSAFFFLLFFNFFSKAKDVSNYVVVNKKPLVEIEKMDSASFASFTRSISKKNKKGDTPMTRQQFKIYLDSNILSGRNQFIGSRYESVAQYDSALKAGKQHNWLERMFTYRIIRLNEKYRGKGQAASEAFKEAILHSLPQLLFISLPLLALLLKMLYFRRKEYYYVSHGIFSIHFYIFVFIVLLLSFSLGLIDRQLHSDVIGWIDVVLCLGTFFYLYKAMRKFYQQRRAKTVLKYFLLLFLFLILLFFLFAAFILYSLFKI